MQKKARASQVLIYNHTYNAGIYPHYVVKGKSQLNHAVPWTAAGKGGGKMYFIKVSKVANRTLNGL